MALTPIDINDKEFSRVFRGYDDNQVDQFLDEVVADFEELYRENIDIKQRLKILKNQANNYKTMEDTLKETLVTAQKTAKEVIEAAQKKSDLIVKEAKLEAKEIIRDADKKVIGIKREFDECKKQIQVFKARFRGLLESQLELLSHELASYEEWGDESLPKG